MLLKKKKAQQQKKKPKQHPKTNTSKKKKKNSKPVLTRYLTSLGGGNTQLTSRHGKTGGSSRVGLTHIFHMNYFILF